MIAILHTLIEQRLFVSEVWDKAATIDSLVRFRLFGVWLAIRRISLIRRFVPNSRWCNHWCHCASIEAMCSCRKGCNLHNH
jgi:hypothetical protein